MDFQGIIQRLRPDAPYLLKDGGGASYSDILEWRDTSTTKPTEAECLAEWDVMLAEWATSKAENDLVTDTETNAVTKYAQLPAWAKTGTAEDAEIYITNQIFNGQDITQVEAWIDSNITGTNVAQLRTQVKEALKITSGAVITTRGLFILVAKLLIYIRDLAIRFRK